MEMRVMLTLTSDEVRSRIPYAMICETRFGSCWETGKRRRLWKQMFSDQERGAAERLFRMAYDWYLRKGVPDKVEMSTRTLVLWQKLGEFCASI